MRPTLTLAAVLATCAPALARAETVFDEYGRGIERRPTQQLFEASCDLDVQLRGAVASVEVRQRIVNPGPDALGAIYELDLPPGATITSLALRGDRETQHALAVPADAPTVTLTRRGVLGADPALLVALGDDRYALTLQPIEAEREVVLTTRYTTLAEVRGGALRVVLPGRAQTGKLTVCRGVLRAVAGPGARVAKLVIDGVESRARGGATFVVDTHPVVLDAELTFTAPQPVVWTQTETLADGWAATAITVVTPPLRTQTAVARRALFVIDGSRSMELVGRHHTARVVRAIAAALPAGITIDAIVHDRAARRVLGAFQPMTTAAVDAIAREVTTRAADNGSDLAGALRLARAALAEATRDTTMVIVISDGVLGDARGLDLIQALDAHASTVDVLGVVLGPARTRSPGAAAIRAPVSLYGGAFVEVTVDELDRALSAVDEWLRPAWLDVAVPGLEVPATVRSGGGFVSTLLHRGPPPRLVLTARGATTVRVGSRVAPSAPIAALALARDGGSFVHGAIDPADLARRDRARQRSEAMAPYAREGVALAVLTTEGTVARNRRAVVQGGGPYERIVELPEPPLDAALASTAPSPPTASAIADVTLEVLFKTQLQPRAYACYQRALGTSPALAGTAHFTFHMGRGEITQVAVAGIDDPAFAACLVEAGYALRLHLPDLAINADDQTLARYPLTFALSDRRAHVVPGDADSSSPLDIDAIEGGVPVKVDTATPLGGLRPTR